MAAAHLMKSAVCALFPRLCEKLGVHPTDNAVDLELFPEPPQSLALREEMGKSIVTLVAMEGMLRESIQDARDDAKERAAVMDKKGAYRCLDVCQVLRGQLSRNQERMFLLEESLANLEAASDAMRVAMVSAHALVKRVELMWTMDQRAFEFKLENAGTVYTFEN